MLKEFTFRFFDTDKHKQGVYAKVVAVDLLQAKEFAYQIAELLGTLNSTDWNKETQYEFIETKFRRFTLDELRKI